MTSSSASLSSSSVRTSSVSTSAVRPPARLLSLPLSQAIQLISPLTGGAVSDIDGPRCWIDGWLLGLLKLGDRRRKRRLHDRLRACPQRFRRASSCFLFSGFHSSNRL